MKLTVDFHCHLLPDMDDGSRSYEESRGMLMRLASQGIKQVFATPHFYSHHESADRFLLRRKTALDKLSASGEKILSVRLGAEVRLEKGISEIGGLQEMAWGKQRCLLIELPYSSYKSWMTEEIYNIVFQQNVTPVIAHLNRYLEWYKKSELQEILDIQGVIVQLNNKTLFERRTLKFALDLLRDGRPVVFGSDAHNLADRSPDFDRTFPILCAKLKADTLQKLCAFSESLLE